MTWLAWLFNRDRSGPARMDLRERYEMLDHALGKLERDATALREDPDTLLRALAASVIGDANKEPKRRNQ